MSELSGNIEESQEIHRHLTALTRTQLSAPMQSLARYGYLDQSKSVFDYGCGKGSDVELLRDSGLDASGWDPYYSPDAIKKYSDIVNLGFVINVIEDLAERKLALASAYKLAGDCLVVSAMLENANARGGTPFKDGVRTSRNTFQKYFSQAELGAFIESVLGVEPVPVAPGIFYAFKTDGAKAAFLTRKGSQRRRPSDFTSRRLPAFRTKPKSHVSPSFRKYQNNTAILEELWTTWVNLGRAPKSNEIEKLEDIRRLLGSYPNALKVLRTVKGDEGVAILEKAHFTRYDDLTVQFAEYKFYRTPPPRPMPEQFKEDVRHFFGNLANAQSAGENSLLQVLDKQKVLSACAEAAEKGLGWLDGCSGQLIPDSILSFSAATTGGMPSLNVWGRCRL
ncbi:DNA phosphorothioation-associated putative methyltransferase [Marinobacter sp. DY40_1A1]|nr:DNA phosphorothioation-associated putative methyltransferase [Marinobacter sp. DY40_1A1]MBK1887083.1 DNA phosphorothioation-associated putative methyltransferase [Marinobacter sp. DY40_1A1]